MQQLKTIGITSLLLFIVSFKSYSQHDDAELFNFIQAKCNKSEIVKPDKTKLFFPLNVMYRFYRSGVSEQLSSNCAFHLTCSRFSAKAFQTFNPLKAILLTTDRLTRCHPKTALQTSPLLFNTQNGKIFDEPEMY